jgi:hypothetical protein
MTALEDVETQRSGIVLCGFNLGKTSRLDRQAAWSISKLKNVLPLRVVGLHYSYDDFKMRPMMALATLVMKSHGRTRFRAHYGSPKQVQQKLQTFGIPKEHLPLVLVGEGEYKVKPHRAWLKKRAQQEVEDAEAGTGVYRITVPGRMDVLFGRGKPIQESPGNLKYHILLAYHAPHYEAAKKFDKMEIARQVVDYVQSYGGRFLRPDHAGWVPVDDPTAREKVSHGFRTRRSLMQTTTTSQQQPTTTTTTTNESIKRHTGGHQDMDQQGGAKRFRA